MPWEKWENASRLSTLSRDVALPPGISSPGSTAGRCYGIASAAVHDGPGGERNEPGE